MYDGAGMASFSTGTCGKYGPYDQEGRFGYLNAYVTSAINQLYRFDCKNRVLQSLTPTEWIQSGTAASGDRLGTIAVFDKDGTAYTSVVLVSHLATNVFELVVFFFYPILFFYIFDSFILECSCKEYCRF